MANVWSRVAPKVKFDLPLDFETFQKLVSTDAKILDYGCGYGRNSLALYEAGYLNVVGYDIEPDLIKRGNQKSPFLSLRCFDPPRLPEENNVFDAALCCAVMTCIPEGDIRRTAMQEITRVLKPGGVLYLAEFLKSPERKYDEGGRFMSRYGVPMKHFQEEELKRLINFFSVEKQVVRPVPRGSASALISFHCLCIKPA